MFINENSKLLQYLDNRFQLNEAVDRNVIIDAINNHDVLVIYYSGDKDNSRGYRTIEPYTLGESTAGNVVLRAWQQGGSSDSAITSGREKDKLPSWRLFLLEKITQVKLTKKKFLSSSQPRPNYNPEDKGMVKIYATFDKEKKVGKEITNKFSSPDQKLNFFDTQYKKFRDYYQKDTEFAKDVDKQGIFNAHEYVSKRLKENPKNYFVYKNEKDEIEVAKENNSKGFSNRPKYANFNILGNLHDLFAKYGHAGKGISKTEYDKKRQEFIDNQKRFINR